MNRQRHFLTLLDHTEEELQELLNMADQLKYEQKNGIAHPHLKGKTLGLIFGELSTRTRVSFEICKWTGASRCRTRPGSWGAIWTA